MGVWFSFICCRGIAIAPGIMMQCYRGHWLLDHVSFKIQFYHSSLSLSLFLPPSLLIVV